MDRVERLVPQAVMDLFTVQGLRRHLLPLDFLRHEIGLEITDDMKTEHVETARIVALLERAEADGRGEDLLRFNQWLILELKPVRTRRLYVSAADRLMRSADVKALGQLDQSMVDRYLSATPGARNDVGAVLRFAKVVLSLSIGLPARKTPRTRAPKPVVELRALLNKIRGGKLPLRIQHLEGVISVAMQIPPKAIAAGDWWPERRGRRWFVVSQSEVVASPVELEDILELWNGAMSEGASPV